MAQNMKLSIVSQGTENVIVEVNDHETFEEFQQKIFRENNLCITIEDFQLFFENLSPGDNLFNCLRENLNIGNEVNSVENAPIYEINLVRDISGNIKDEHSSSFTINDAIENATAEHFDAYKEVQNLDTSLMVLNQEQAAEYTNILNENIFEPSNFDQNSKKLEESDQGITLYSENNDLMTNNYNENAENNEKENVNNKFPTTDAETIKVIETPVKQPETNEPNNENYNYMDIESKLAQMHEYNEEVMTDLCRLCTKNITKDIKIQIYDMNLANNKLNDKINISLPIKIMKEDGLPQQICSSCSDRLNTCYEFVQIVVEADKQLRIKFSNVLNESENFKNTTVSEFMSEFLDGSPESKPVENHPKNVKFEPEESIDIIDNDFETEYLETEETESKTDNEKPNCRLCDLIIDNLDEAVNHGITVHHINDLFACVFCELGFQQSNLLDQHVKQEHRNLFTESRKYQCTVCSKKYGSQILLLKHTCVKSAANKTLHCEVCNQAFPTKVRLNFHRQFHLKDARPLHCAVCSMSFDNENEFFDHVNFMHDSKQSFPCDICDKTFSIRAALNNHKKMHTGIRNHRCETCNKTFLDKQTLKEHEVSHMETKPYQCHICGKNLNRLSRLRRHLLTHESNPVVNDVLVCDICKEAFADDGSAEFHKTYKHDNKKNCIKIINTDKVFRCEFCEKCYYTPLALNEHRNIHTGPTPYTCHICKAQFSSYPRCTTHKTTHGLYKDGAEKDNFPVVKHFLCEHCGKSYLHWTYLGLHRRLKHSENVQVYKCTDCKLQFPNSWGLAYHRKTKHFQENYKCKDCGKVLANEHCLKLHYLTRHSTQRKDNQCVICGKIFQYQTSLEAHMKSHKGLKEYKCALCPKSFIHLAGLTSHFIEHKARKFVFPNEGETSNRYKLNHTDRPFTCDTCGLSFRRQFTLRNHRLKHTKPADAGSFVLMVDMKEDEHLEQEEDKTIAEQPIQIAEPALENKPPEQEMNFIQLAPGQELAQNYIDMGNGSYLQVQGNTFNIGGKEYILVDENGKAVGRNEEFEMIVDETLRGEDQANQASLTTEQQFDNNTVMYVESDNNSYVINNQNEMQSDYIFTTDNKALTKTVTTGSTTYVIGGNEFLLQTDDQTF